jgi:hypothetical protein
METFTPSTAWKVNFGNGKVIHMNRAERRRNKLYGDNVTKTKAVKAGK